MTSPDRRFLSRGCPDKALCCYRATYPPGEPESGVLVRVFLQVIE